MFEKLLKHLKQKNTSKSNLSTSKKTIHFQNKFIIEKNIKRNLENFKGILSKSEDVIFREFNIIYKKQIKVFDCRNLW